MRGVARLAAAAVIASLVAVTIAPRPAEAISKDFERGLIIVGAVTGAVVVGALIITAVTRSTRDFYVEPRPGTPLAPPPNRAWRVGFECPMNAAGRPLVCW